MTLKRDPKIRSLLLKEMGKIIFLKTGFHPDRAHALADEILMELEKKGWHGVRE